MTKNGEYTREYLDIMDSLDGDVPGRDLPIKEAHKLAQMSFYGLSKVTAERYLELYHEQFGLDYVVLRFANVYGERQGDGGEGGVISIFARSVAEGKAGMI